MSYETRSNHYKEKNISFFSKEHIFLEMCLFWDTNIPMKFFQMLQN